jgi:hypothetical protein
MVDDIFIAELTKKLLDLSDVANHEERHKSWMTAEQISRWWSERGEEHVSPERIDEMLRAWWLRNPESRDIRPAKYPHRYTAHRLWGHVERVRRRSEAELRMFRTDEPIELEKTIQLESNCPQYFLSYAAPDLHYAARVRLSLMNYGVCPWMYAGEMMDGDLLFEGVEAALSASQRLLALTTPLTLASAWVDTEIHTADQIAKPVTIVFDGSHHALMDLLRTWRPPCNDEPCFEPALLPPLEREYACHYREHEHRLSTYRESATKFLRRDATSFELAVYPRRPRHWKGDERFKDFDTVIGSHAK